MKRLMICDMNISDNIVRLRKKANMTQNYVAIQLQTMGLNISRSRLSVEKRECEFYSTWNHSCMILRAFRCKEKRCTGFRAALKQIFRFILDKFLGFAYNVACSTV